jgi:GNAT superfamily N-acetyltransferase
MDARSFSVQERLRDGSTIHIRAIRPDDKERLSELFFRLSPETIYYRFLGAKRRLTREELTYLTELDFRRQVAIVAVLAHAGTERIVGVGRYAIPSGGLETRAEVALTVEDAEQGRGIGKLLFENLTHIARGQGIEEFEAHVFAENTRMVGLFERSGRVTGRSVEGGVCHLLITTSPTHPPSRTPSPRGNTSVS